MGSPVSSSRNLPQHGISRKDIIQDADEKRLGNFLPAKNQFETDIKDGIYHSIMSQWLIVSYVIILSLHNFSIRIANIINYFILCK